MEFPISLAAYEPVPLDASKELHLVQREQLERNIQLIRDSIVFFTAYAGAKGLGGHTGGAYDIVPEVLLMDGFMRGNKEIIPIFFDEAGHRVAMQYMMAALDPNKGMTLEHLLHYREFDWGLYGHPERDEELGIDFSSGRLGHMWSYVNGISLANPKRKVILFGSDGSQQEGNNAEAARFAVAHNLEVKLIIDDNNITITGHPSEYMPGFNVGKTLRGQGLVTLEGKGENLRGLHARVRSALLTPGPVALINQRLMAPGIPDIEGTHKGHDVVPTDSAIKYLEGRGYHKAVEMLKAAEKVKPLKDVYLGSSPDLGTNRKEFGNVVAGIISKSKKKNENLYVFDCDLAGSTGLNTIAKAAKNFTEGGIMERHAFAAAAGVSYFGKKQGMPSTFSAFQEMNISEITMARLNQADVLAHFSHSGVDWMADNTCHYGINNFFADNGLEDDGTTRLYFPADPLQMKAVVEEIFDDPGLRFVFSTRSPVHFILDNQGEKFFDPKNGYVFHKDRDEIIRKGKDGYIVSYGEMLYRSLDAVEQLKQHGIEVGLINKPTLNVVDEKMMRKVGSSPFVLVVESQNRKTGLGIRYGTWLNERDLAAKYRHMGTIKQGHGGIYQQIPYQGLDPDSIVNKVKEIVKK